ncbi:MAG TPA: VWA domain-containing protein [Gemmataceae bacterium]|nr:VWA domain-containing protein [Gemmataceae bacterium]
MMPPFANPAYLWLMLAVPPLLWWWLHRRRNALRHPAVGELMGLPAGKARAARWGPGVLRALALLSMVIALAGPRWPDLRTRIETEGIAIILLVDVSGSMAERDFDWRGEPISRLEAVKKVFHLFVSGGTGAEDTGDGTALAKFQGRPTDLLGLVTFATRPETACPLTLSHSVLLRLLDAEQPRSIPGESETNISDAVAMGLHRLRGVGPRRKVLVLLSDGEHNVPQPQSGWTPRQAAQVANGLHVPIYTIDAGGPGASIKESKAKEGSELERTASPGETRAQAVRTLEELAHITHGKYFQAHDTKGLLAACQSIDTLERTDIQSFQYRRYHEGYPWFALAAFVLFSTAVGLERTIWRRIP